MATSILSAFDAFQFSVLACDIETALSAVRLQGKEWGKSYTVNGEAVRDIRPIYCSQDGPANPPAIVTAILLAEAPSGQTLFVSNVGDGYSSMVRCISRDIPGEHLSVRVSKPSAEYPISEFTIVEDFAVKRIVRVMREESGWDFFDRGPLAVFEDPAFYQAKKKADRLTPDILALYLERFGAGSLDYDYWIGNKHPAQLLYEQSFRLASCD